jgi:hypothetical protein
VNKYNNSNLTEAINNNYFISIKISLYGIRADHEPISIIVKDNISWKLIRAPKIEETGTRRSTTQQLAKTHLQQKKEGQLNTDKQYQTEKSKPIFFYS